jgi:hypothetical protein
MFGGVNKLRYPNRNSELLARRLQRAALLKRVATVALTD